MYVMLDIYLFTLCEDPFHVKIISWAGRKRIYVFTFTTLPPGIVQERLRYVPLGWAKYYEFNESDLRVACDTLDTWIDATAMGRTNLPPEKVPWEALVTLLSQCIYGGKIDNAFDQRLLHSFLCKLFTPRSFEADFALVANVDGVSGNFAHTKKQFIEVFDFSRLVDNV